MRGMVKALGRPLLARFRAVMESSTGEVLDRLGQIEGKLDDTSTASLERISFQGKQLVQLQAQVESLQGTIDDLVRRLDAATPPSN